MKATLKQITFEWVNNDLLIIRDGFVFAVPKRYLFSLQRFITRIAQKEFRRKKR